MLVGEPKGTDTKYAEGAAEQEDELLEQGTGQDDTQAVPSRRGKFQRPSSTQSTPFTTMALLLTLFMLISSVSWRFMEGSKLGPPKLPAKGQPKALDSPKHSLVALRRELEDLTNALNDATTEVRTVFIHHYANGIVDLPVKIREYMDSVSKWKVPSGKKGGEARREQALRIGLLRAIVAAAKVRVDALNEMETFCQERKWKAPIFMLMKFPVTATSTETENAVKFRDFYKMIGVDADIDRCRTRRAAGKTISQGLARNGAAELWFSERRKETDRRVHDIFHDFLDLLEVNVPETLEFGPTFNLALLSMPGNHANVPLSFLNVYLSRFGMERRTTTRLEIRLAALADQWTEKSVADIVSSLRSEELSTLSKIKLLKGLHRQNFEQVASQLENQRHPDSRKLGKWSDESLLSIALYLL